MNILGIDAGGTKTHCMIADESKRILGEAVAGPAQHQIYGIEQTRTSLRAAIGEALQKAGLALSDIAYGVFGMSGADGPDDFELLIPAVQEIMGDIPFQVVHDAWLGFYSAIEGDMGVVSICGTGAAHAGRNSRGEQLTLRNLDYITGNLGGGSDLADKALHYAFRSEEGTWDKSSLEELIPPIFDAENMEQVCAVLKQGKLTREQKYHLPIAVFKAANDGDKVAQSIISTMGYEEGRYASAVITRLGMQQEEVPMVLIGSLFHTGNPFLIGSYMGAVHEVCPKAYEIIPDAAPVTGAICLGIKLVNQ